MMVEATKKISPTLQKLERKGRRIEDLPLIKQHLARATIATELGEYATARDYANKAIDDATNAVVCKRKIGALLPMVPIREIVYWNSDDVGPLVSANLAKETKDALVADILRFDFFNHPIVSLVMRKLSIIPGLFRA